MTVFSTINQILTYRIRISASYTGASTSYLTHPYPSRGKEKSRTFTCLIYTVTYDIIKAVRDRQKNMSSGSQSDISESLVMPDSKPRDGFCYLPRTPMIDFYIIKPFLDNKMSIFEVMEPLNILFYSHNAYPKFSDRKTCVNSVYTDQMPQNPTDANVYFTTADQNIYFVQTV